ncbi:uncharacterized protein LOC144453037 isoform X2 [Glandiceps talaboti]
MHISVARQVYVQKLSECRRECTCFSLENKQRLLLPKTNFTKMISRMTPMMVVFVLPAFLVFCVDAYLAQPPLRTIVQRAEIDNHQQIDINPEDTIVEEGDDILLKCHISDKKGKAVWGKDYSDLLAVERLPFAERERVSVEGIGNEYDLVIRGVQKSDQGVYNCYVTSDGIDSQLRSNDAVLTVV